MERIVAEYRAEIAGAAFPRRAHPHLHPRDDMKEEKKPLSFLFCSGAVEEDGQTSANRYSFVLRFETSAILIDASKESCSLTK